MTHSITPSPSELFQQCNDSELYQMARAAGFVVSPAARKADLIKYLLGEAEPPAISHEVDRWRRGIMGFVLEHWRALETQLTCPARTKEPTACFNCLDQQVVTCLVQNANDVHLIQVHKKDQ